ncbi:MAG: hypothetical protein IT406_03975 [Candidatus Yanofskybacteria bacterium]|nr:hypothetical protein [Candidatus Yanofskybacteria bacterium]
MLMKIRALFVAVLAFLALPAAAQVVDSRWEVLTEQVLRSNEDYFFYLFNNGQHAPVHANTLLDNGGHSYWFTAAKLSNGEIRLAFVEKEYYLDFASTETLCVCGGGGTLMPFPVTKQAWSKKKPKVLRVTHGPRSSVTFYPYRPATMLWSRRFEWACIVLPDGVSLEYVHSYFISPEMHTVIRRWLWEKWGDTARLADNP